MPLSLADKNKPYIIRRIVGTEVSVISEIDGNFVASVKGARIGLAVEYAKRIIVG